MRQKRAKAYRKLMQLYSMTFGFRQPYQVLIDSEMCKESIIHKLELKKQLQTVLQGEIKPMITQCCIHELYLQGKSQQLAVDLAKTFERRKCNHREPIPGENCLVSVIGDTNKHRYVVASQTQPLRVKLRAIPATPLIHLTRSVMVLEPPSEATLAAKEKTEEGRLRAFGSDLPLVDSSTKAEPPKKKRKGPKGPNPLSIKKKTAHAISKPITKKLEPSATSTPNVGDKRRADDVEGNDGGEGGTSRPSRRRKRRKTTASHEGRAETPVRQDPSD